MRPCIWLVLLSCVATPTRVGEIDLTTLERGATDFLAPKITATRADLASVPWTFLKTKETHDNFELTATCTLRRKASLFGFFGASWSVWPDPTYGDQGYEVGLLARGSDRAGYRVQLSHRYQQVALVRYPEAGFVRVAACTVRLDQPHRLQFRLVANTVQVHVDGELKIDYCDPLPLLPAGVAGVGTSSQGRVEIERVALSGLPSRPVLAGPGHEPRLSMRTWLGERSWIFDGDEPILLLPTPAETSINNVKLRPGHRPMLSWNSHWDIANQGAFPEGKNTQTPVKALNQGGKTMKLAWSARQVKGRFETRTTMTVGFDAKRQTYTYDIDSELEVLPGEAFHFRYGYDFEHHTPLDPFRWQYLVFRQKGGRPVHRPVYPIDPGPQMDLETQGGLRLWYGRHLEDMVLAPAVEYRISGASTRKLNTAVCAAFYDTGVSFAAETARPGTRVQVRYRYTGYPAEEARALFRESTVYESPMLDPEHHYLFADDWPRLTFEKFVPLSKTWIYGRRPFLTGHNRRPTYELVRIPASKQGRAGHAMKLGPAAFGAAALATPADLAPGRYALLAQVKSEQTFGPGGRIELTVSAPKTGKELAKHVHYLGRGSFDWKKTGFVFEVPVLGAGLHLGLGNAGTGAVLVREVEFRKLADNVPLPEGVLRTPAASPTLPAAPAGALADYRMEEQQGQHVYNHAGGPLGLLELANVDWARIEGRNALVFQDVADRNPTYPRMGNLHQNYLIHPGYRGRDRVPVALTGHHGGGMPLEAFTLAAWIRPASRMGKSEHGGKGDILGLGARRVVLRLVGDTAPYQLSASVNVNDVLTAPSPQIQAGRWHHVALVGEPEAGNWRLRLHVDGKQVHEGKTSKQSAPMTIPPSLILGAEIFYFHDAYYRGALGQTLVFTRALSPDEIARLAR